MMDDEIGASPTSQKKRKKRSRVSQKISKMDENNRDVITEGLSFDQAKISDVQGTVSQTLLTRNDMWKYEYLVNKVDKVSASSVKSRVFSQCNKNEFRKSGQIVFPSATQLHAIHMSSQTNEVKETQWNITESQLRRIDDELHELEVKGQEIGDSVQINEEIMEELTEPVGEVLKEAENDEFSENANSSQNSFEGNITVRSILSDWPTSPVKRKCSPLFIFYKKRLKKTYSRKRNIGETRKQLTEFKASSSPSSSSCNENAVHSDDNDENFDREFSQQQNDTTKADDEDDPMNESIVDNLQSLCEYYTQRSETMDDDSETVTGLECHSLSKSPNSLDKEEDFPGFDGHPNVTLPLRFYEFDSHSDSSIFAAEEDFEDENMFSNLQKDQYGQLTTNYQDNCFDGPVAPLSISGDEEVTFSLFSDDLLPKESHHSVINSRAAYAAVNLFEDIERDYELMNRSAVSNNSNPSEFSCPRATSAPISCAVNDFLKRTLTQEKLRKRRSDVVEDYDLKTKLQGSPAEFSNVPAFAGFTTVTGKNIPVSSAQTAKEGNTFQSVKVSGDELGQMINWNDDNERVSISETLTSNNSGIATTTTFAGFRTVSGKNISVSSANMANNTKIFQSIEVSSDELGHMKNWINDNESNGGITTDILKPSRADQSFASFSTVSGKQIPVSSDLMAKKANIFQNVMVSADELGQMSNWIDDNKRNVGPNITGSSNYNHSESTPSPAFAGFTTGSGKNISVSSALMAKNANIFQNVKVSADDLGQMNNWIDDNEPSDSPQVLKPNNSGIGPKPTFASFSTVSGKTIPVSTAQMSKNEDIFRNVKVSTDELWKMSSWIDDLAENINLAECSTHATSPMSNCTEPEKMKPSNSNNLFREVTNIAQREADLAPKKLPIDTSIKPSPLRKMSLVNSLRKFKENVDGNEGVSTTTSMMYTPTSSRVNVCITPTNNPKTLTQEVRESAAAFIQDEESTFANFELTPGYVAEFRSTLTVSSTPIQRGDNYRNRPLQRRLVERFDDIAGEDYVDSSVPLDTLNIHVPANIVVLRKQAFEEQLRSISKKSSVIQKPSSLFVKKLTSTKVNWKEFVDNSRPRNKLLTDTKLTNDVLNLTAENATNFKFNARDYFPDEFCRENINGIHLSDDIVVMMDEKCQVGLREISTAFLSCPSVDPKLVHEKWIENHMKWIFVKLAGMERSFPHKFSGRTLTLEHAMTQIKYRYEREIDRAERSAIHRICEMDDVAAKRMILFVASIRKSGFSCDIELSDGWYSMWSTLDSEMTRFVINGKIKVGTKLVVQGASTTNLDNGCHPLDIPNNVRLKLHANSTRRARWDSKLGYCTNPEPFKISLPSVLANGGNITKLSICVLRVYPVTYINPKNTKELHSEKVEKRRSLNEREKLDIVDKIYSQVSRDYEEEEKAIRLENRPKKIKVSEISSITDAALLCDLLDTDIDPSSVVEEMTPSQKTMVRDYKERMNCLRAEILRARVNEKLASVDKDSRKFVALLRFKVVDETSFNRTAIVTVWKPDEELFSMIQEGGVYEITGSAARGIRWNVLQIYAGKDAVFKKLNVTNNVPISLRRQHICISDIHSIDQLILNELDTFGLVVHVGEPSQSCQLVYIADRDQNVVCINFQQNIKAFAYDDVVRPKKFLAMKNLQWRNSNNSTEIPCTYATENSVFTENPQSVELTSAIDQLKMQFANVDLDEFIDSCTEKIRLQNSSVSLTPLSMSSSTSSILRTPSNVSLQQGHSSLKNQR